LWERWLGPRFRYPPSVSEAIRNLVVDSTVIFYLPLKFEPVAIDLSFKI
jgi:hypothetical protein